MTKEEREDLTRKLAQFRGAIGEIATRAGMSRQMVNLIMRGDYPGDNVLEIASEVLEERKKRRDEAVKRYQSIIATL